MDGNLDIPTSSKNDESYKVSYDKIYVLIHTHTQTHIFPCTYAVHGYTIYTTIDSCNANISVIFTRGVK